MPYLVTSTAMPLSCASRSFRADYSVIPSATFIDPEVARVGLNEREAQDKGIGYEVTRYGIDDLRIPNAGTERHPLLPVDLANGVRLHSCGSSACARCTDGTGRNGELHRDRHGHLD